MFHTDARRKRPLGSPAVQATARATFTLLVEAVARGLEGNGDPFETASIVWLALHGRVQIQRTMPWFQLPDEHSYVDALLQRHVGCAPGADPERHAPS